MPVLSIITVNLNDKEGLARTLDSVKQQTKKDFELIVVDGLSQDGSLEIIKEYAQIITKTIIEKDTGVYDAMNKGIAAAEGDYFFFLNAGDHFIHSDCLAKAIKELNGEDLLCFDIAMKGKGHDYIKSHPDKISLSDMLTGTLAHQAVIIHKRLFDQLGPYDDTLKIVADWKFFLEALLLPKTKYKAVHEVLTQYYLDGMSATAEGTFKRRAERKELLEGYFRFLNESRDEHLLLQTNRFKMLNALESSKAAKKLNSAWLRLLLRLFKNKGVNQL